MATTTLTRFGSLWAVALMLTTLGGCAITHPKGQDGGPLTAAEMTGNETGIGLDFIITRETGARWTMVRTCLPNNQVVYVMKSADFYRVPQYIVDNMDAVTRGQFFRDLANVGYTWMSAGVGSYYFGLTTPKNAVDIDRRNRSQVEVEWDGTINGNFNHNIHHDHDSELPDPT